MPPSAPGAWSDCTPAAGFSTADEPSTAYLPFDERASGHVPGEGGALLVLEPTEAARARGARVYGEISGCAATFDGREPGLRRAVELALTDAGLDGDVDVVFADAAADPELDRAEAEALVDVFGAYGVPVTAPKTMTGRLYAGAASLDLAAAFLALADGLVPPTVHTEPADRHGLDLVLSQPRPADLRTALVLARGHGGFNSAMVVRAAER